MPRRPDPLEIAFLRGGRNEVIRVTTFDLIQRGRLRLVKTSPRRPYQLVRAARPTEAGELTPLERAIVGESQRASSIIELFESRHIATLADGVCAPYARRCEDERLLTPADAAHLCRGMALSAGVLLLALAGYKLSVALDKGHFNVAFLIILALLGLILLMPLGRTPRLTRRGRAYLYSLRLAFADLRRGARRPKREPAAAPNALEAESAAVAGGNDLLLLAGVYGVSALAGTGYGEVNEAFARSRQGTQSSSGCGSACGSGASCGAASSCGGGSSCGSSCGGGGCGGGGCGGCGGS